MNNFLYEIRSSSRAPYVYIFIDDLTYIYLYLFEMFTHAFCRVSNWFVIHFIAIKFKMEYNWFQFIAHIYNNNYYWLKFYINRKIPISFKVIELAREVLSEEIHIAKKAGAYNWQKKVLTFRVYRPVHLSYLLSDIALDSQCLGHPSVHATASEWPIRKIAPILDSHLDVDFSDRVCDCCPYFKF